jgi:HlyD family secretion protein
MNKRLIAIAAVVIVAIVLIGTKGFGLLAGDRDGPLTIYGNVDIREVDLGFRVGGRIDRILVQEGQSVAKGQELAALDTAPLDARVAEANAAVGASQAQLKLLREGNRAEDISQAKAAVAAAQSAYAKAQADYDRREGLVEPGAISRSAWQATVAQRDNARAQLDQAQQQYAKLRAGARKEEIAAAEAQLQSSEAIREASQTDRNDTRLFAPSAGTIVTRAQEPGAIVAPGQTLLTVSIDRPMRVRAYVGEADLGRVAPGQKVEISRDGSDKVYHGTIGYISPQAEFTPKTVQTEDLRTDLVYRMRIFVTDPDEHLRQGQPVTVTVPPLAAVKG